MGHSTGGLDIRWLLLDLHRRRNESIAVDGGAQMKLGGILDCVRRVVFLSVPHWGTNIADWVRAHGLGREAVVTKLRAAVEGSQVPILDRIEGWTTATAASLTSGGLLRAVQDSLSEADERCGKPGPERTADAHEAASELALYLRQMASDFRAIDDLASERPPGGPESPAHLGLPARRQEIQMWKDRKIEALSYVTLGNRPFAFDPDRSAPPWELAKPWTYPEISKDGALSVGTDIAYRTCYRACAGGPFERPALSGKAARRAAAQGDIALWENDGIVNTLSMFWPEGENVVVPADHMDIVGHYKPVLATPGGGRTFQAYDLLESASGFHDKTFQKIWNDIFAFCAGRQGSKQAVA